MRSIQRVTQTLCAAALAATLATSPVTAQTTSIQPTVYGSAQADTKHTQFYLLGLYLGMPGLGWTPYATVNGYHLSFPSGTGRGSLNAVSPTVGLAFNTPTN